MWWTKRERKCKSNKRTERKRDQTDGERDNKWKERCREAKCKWWIGEEIGTTGKNTFFSSWAMKKRSKCVSLLVHMCWRVYVFVCVRVCVRAFTSANVRAHARAWAHMCVCECVSQVSEKGKGEVGKRKIVVRFRAKLNRTGAQRGRSLGCFPGRGKLEFKRASASKAADILL